MIKKIKKTEVKAYREAQIKRQRGICPLCKLELLPADATLDHCHESGRIRQALHRSCNSAEGRVLMWAGKRSRGDDPMLFIKNLAKYWAKDYSNNPYHHTHGVTPRKKRRTRMRKR